MGTRAIIRFFDDRETEPFAAMYEQCDGYPSRLGVELQRLYAEHGKGSNGMACFAATVVSKLKKGPFGTYLIRPNTRVERALYTYDLRLQPEEGTGGRMHCRLWGYDGVSTEYDGLLRDAPWKG